MPLDARRRRHIANQLPRSDRPDRDSIAAVQPNSDPTRLLGELKHPVAPKPVRDWAANPPTWLEVLVPQGSFTIAQLDPGESEAIALAMEMHAALLLIDEQAGRQEAARRGLKIAGTLSVLDEADRAGFVNFDAAVASLRQTSFWVSEAVLFEIKKRRSR